MRSVSNNPIWGREAETYLRYIIDHYDELPPHVIFSQGDPYIHQPDFDRFLTPQCFETLNKVGYQGLTRWYKKRAQSFPPPKVGRQAKVCGAIVRQYEVSAATIQILGFQDRRLGQYIANIAKHHGTDMMFDVYAGAVFGDETTPYAGLGYSARF